MSDTREPGLRREIGFAGSSFLSFNGMVGAGIFALPATLHLQFGGFSPWLFPIFGLLFLAIALPFARVAGHFPDSGGPVAYTAAFGPFASFQIGWLYYVARAAASAANANVFATYAATLWAPLGAGLGRAALLVALLGALTWVNVVGVKRAMRTLDALTLLKALPLIGLAIWGLAVAGAPAQPVEPPTIDGFEAAALIILYVFVGFENSVVPAGETRDAERTVPRALIATLAMTALLYLLVQLAYVGTMPAGAEPKAPLVALAETLGGAVAGLVITVTALFSVTGNIAGTLVSTPRVTFALAGQGALPRWFGAVSARYGTPANSVIFLGGLAIVLAITGSFVWLAVVSTLARMVIYAASIAALPAAERRAGKTTSIGTFALMAAGILVCVWAASQSAWPAWRMLLALAAGGTVLYAIARFWARKV